MGFLTTVTDKLRGGADRPQTQSEAIARVVARRSMYCPEAPDGLHRFDGPEDRCCSSCGQEVEDGRQV